MRTSRYNSFIIDTDSKVENVNSTEHQLRKKKDRDQQHTVRIFIWRTQQAEEWIDIDWDSEDQEQANQEIVGGNLAEKRGSIFIVPVLKSHNTPD